MYGNRYEDDNGKHKKNSIAKIICYKKFDTLSTSILWIFNFDKKNLDLKIHTNNAFKNHWNMSSWIEYVIIIKTVSSNVYQIGK